ncbi:MAG TPA: AAA family ATPase [Candidatus Anaerobiospirillum pullistercoris]|uniref:AAA family ATPase n=1 Tax=Candidatus Anaerobiospirillum pullistercoris TaxID=2838452 RepID=A0A9D2B1B3_9GAMM|nr:AAA family ATPase [Candidatus Anaerobiospirillum pullistercoris]
MSDLPDLSAILSTNLTSFFLAIGAVAIVILSIILAFFYFRINAHFDYRLQLKGDHEDLLKKVQNLEIELKEKQSLKEDVEKQTARIKSEYEQFAANKETIDQVKGQLNALGSEYQGKLQQLQDLDRELSKSEALKDFINNHQQEQLDALDQKINDKEERLKELSDQVNEKLSSGIAKDSLNQMFSELADNSNLKSESQKLQQEIEDLRKQYDVNAARLIEQEKELNTGKLNDAINKAFTSFNEQAIRAQQEQELSSKLEQLSQQVQEKEEKLSELKEEISNKSNQNQLSDALNTAFEQLSDTNDFRKLTSQLNELKNNVAAKQKELDDLQSQVNEQQSNNLLSETLGQTFDDLKDTLSQSMQNLASELGEQSLLTAQKNQLKQEVFALEKAKSDQASAAKALQKELNDLKAQLDEQRSSSQISEALSNAISSINGQNELNDQQRVLNNKLDDLKRQISKKQDELDDLQSQVDEQRSSSQISEALSNAIFSISGQNELNDQQRVLNNKLDNLKRQISKKQDELDDLQSQVNEQQSTNLLSETLGQAFDDLKDTLSQSMQNLASELATQSQLTAQKTQLQQEVAALEEKAKSAHTVEASNTAYEELEQTPAAIENFLKRFDGTEVKDEGTALELFQDYLKGEGFFYSPRTLKAFHTSLKVQNINPISVLAGLSGTGKTQLALQYAKFFNFYSEHVAVQPRWDSKDDLLGFYNFLEKRYQPTELVKALYYFHQIRNNSDSPMMMVILDEMNLARVEYYFSEFLSKLELRGTDRNQPEDKSKISIGTQLNSRDFFVGSNVVFVGTMNDDESTYSLSDKVLDRANVLHFGKPKSFEDNIRYDKVSQIYVNADTFNDWCSQENFPNNFPEALRSKINTLNNALDSVGKAFGYRVNNSITHYIQMYPDIKSSANPEESALIALADQIEMKIIPKLAGLEQNEKSDTCLSSIDNEIRDTHDEELIKAFKIAKDNYETNGMFLWRGVSRSIDQA